MFLLVSAGAIYVTGLVNQFMETQTWKPLEFEYCISIIQSGGRPFQMWLILELIALAISIYIFFTTGKEYYKSELYKVTDTLSIPMKAGQGQFGTSWFASKSEIHKRYTKLKLSTKDPLVKKLLENGDKRREAVKEYEKSQKVKRKPKKTKKVKIVQTERLVKVIPAQPIEETPDEKSKQKKSKVSEKFQELHEKIQCGQAVLREKLQDISYSLSGLLVFRVLRRIKNKLTRRRAERKIIQQAAAADEQPEQLKVKKDENTLAEKGGIVIDEPDEKTVYCITTDQHTLVNGSTSSGKTRSLVLPSLCALALAGESIIATDIKGELNAYAADFLRSLGYNVIVLNFTDTALSDRYNLLQPIIDAVNEDDISKAISRAWDLTTFLVEKNERTEPIWRNGEMSVIAAAILCVVYDNRRRPKFQNMTNVYHFVSEMFREYPPEPPAKKPFRPIDNYLKCQPSDHPARGLLGISAVAPDKTAGSFYTSALTTLQLFTSPEIYGITNSSDFDLRKVGNEKTALFFVLPENKTTYYPIVTLICSQLYDILTESAKETGNRLKRRVNFLMDEFGNFSKISDFVNMLTVGRGYGIRFNLFVQSFAQLKEKYGDNALTTIQDNCIWIYLSAGAEETNKAWENRLGKYTTTSYSVGGSVQHRTSYQSSSNVSLTGRELLRAEEIAQIKRPYILSSENQQHPAVTRLPDISQLIFNRFLGMGNVQHNALLIEMTKQKGRLPAAQIELWEIWERYKHQ